LSRGRAGKSARRTIHIRSHFTPRSTLTCTEFTLTLGLPGACRIMLGSSCRQRPAGRTDSHMILTWAGEGGVGASLYRSEALLGRSHGLVRCAAHLGWLALSPHMPCLAPHTCTSQLTPLIPDSLSCLCAGLVCLCVQLDSCHCWCMLSV
jgi:hypothetical protein